MSGVLLIFGLPMITAAVLISPSALHNLVHGVLLYAILALLRIPGEVARESAMMSPSIPI